MKFTNRKKKYYGSNWLKINYRKKHFSYFIY